MRKLLSIFFIFAAFKSFSQADSTKKDTLITDRNISSVNEQYKKYIPNYSPQSPNTAQSIKFGEYGVNLATGIPDIQIPLYSVTAGGITLPITLKYHASGHKLKSKATWVGWGWALDVGEGVARTVHGLPDDVDGNTGKNYLNTTLLSSRDPCSNTTNYDIINSARNNTQDLEPDIYSYSTGISSGKFILGANGAEPFLIPWQAIKVNKTLNSAGFLSEFEIIETNGTAFKFGKDRWGNLAQESQNSIHGRWSKQYVSNWNLTQVLSPNNKDSINLYYQSGGNVYQEDYQWSASIIANETGNYFTNTPTATALASTSSTISTENNIHYIKYPNGEVEFIQSLPNETRSDAVNSRYLKQIKIYTYADNQKVLLKTVDFFYSYFKNSNNQDARLKLDSIAINHSNVADRQVYKFDYFTNNFSWDDSYNSHLKQDFFGYYNGQNNTSLITLSSLNVATAGSPNPISITNGGANRQSSSAYSKECVLEKITFPSGGFTTFDFENNQFYNGSSGVLGGGLRVKNIKTYKAVGTQPIVKRYQYASEHGLGIGKLPTNWKPDTSDMVFRQTIHYEDLGTIGLTGTADQFIISPYSQIEMASIEGAPVYYTQVDEYFEEDTASLKNGKNQYFFSFERDILYSKPYANPRTYNSHKRGLLLNKKTFTDTGVLVSERVNQYQDFKVSSVLGGGYVANENVYVESGVYGICSTNMPVSPIGPEMQYYSHNYFTGNRKLIASTETIDSVSITKAYSYDNNLLLKTTTTDDSYTNHYVISETIYPTDAGYNADVAAIELRNRHMIDIPLETIEKESLNGTVNTLFRQKTIYSTFSGSNTRGFSNNILPKEIWVAPKGVALEKRIEYIAYDTYGNPLEYKQDEVSNSMLWAYNNSLLIGMVKNATVGQVNAALSSTGLNIGSFSVTHLSNAQLTTLANFRVALPNTQVSWFTHIPQVGISSTHAPNGLVTRYEYDDFQRLVRTKDHEGNLLTVNQYKINPTHNYIATSNLRVATTHTPDAYLPLNAKISYQLFDGLGRPTQALGYGQTPDLKTLLGTEISYDRWGRTLQNLLAVSTGTLGFAPISNAKNLAQSFYNDAAPADSTVYEASPLNRTKASFGAGQAWRGLAGSPSTHKNTQIFYESAGSDVRYYTVNNANSVILNGFYPAKSLFKKRIIDEQGNTSIEISDKRGRLVQKQVQKDHEGNWLTTYYCYDGLGRTRAILQPMAYNLNQTINATDPTHRDYVFAFDYDSRGRLIREDIPGAEERYSVYDKRDRLVMQKDALQNSTSSPNGSKWNFWKYDAFDREVMRGETAPIGFTQGYWASLFASHSPINETWGSGGYDGQSFPSAVQAGFNEIQLYTFYDQYDFVSALNTNLAFDAGNAYHGKHTSAIGLQTGTVAYNQADHNQYFMTAQYYDTKNRPIQTFETHLLSPTLPNRSDVQYNFAGEILQNRMLHKQVSKPDIVELYENEYDHVGRLLKTFHTLNGTKMDIARLGYDQVGRLLQKKIKAGYTYKSGISDFIIRNSPPPTNTQDFVRRYVLLNPGFKVIPDTLSSTPETYHAYIDTLDTNFGTTDALQTIDYQYNVRNGLRCVNCEGNDVNTINVFQNDLFAMKLDFHETGSLFDGNIAKQTWIKATDKVKRQYSYTYDPSKRLTAALFQSTNNENFSLPNISYDDNGNILNLQRKANKSGGYGLVDSLVYSYSGNRLMKVVDGVTGNTDIGDFRDSTLNIDYSYYANGGLKSDGNKEINLIEYNTYLDKVKQVTFLNGDWLKFYYDGSGTLIARENSKNQIWKYIGNSIYLNDTLYQIGHSEGRISLDTNQNFVYEFEYRDHLGNFRLSYKDPTIGTPSERMAPEIVQTSESDPWGWDIRALKFSPENSQNFIFQKQEMIKDFGLDINWFKYRPFDPQLGRGWQIDRLAVKYSHNSPYAFSENKVTTHIELDGLEAVAIIGGADLDSKGLTETTKNLQKQIQKDNPNIPQNNIQTFNTDPLNLGGVESQVVNFIKEKTADNNGPVVIYGYSLGGIVATSAANTLKESDKKVDMLVTVDAAAGPVSQPLNISENVVTNVNFFQPNSSSIGSRGYESTAIDSQKTNVININVEQITRPALKIDHRNIDEVTSKASASLINKTLKSQ